MYPETEDECTEFGCRLEQAKKVIAELRDERDVFKRTLDKRDKRIAELERGVLKGINLLRESNHIDARAALLMLKVKEDG